MRILLSLFCCLPIYLLAQTDDVADAARDSLEQGSYRSAATLFIEAAEQEADAEKSAAHLIDAGNALRKAGELDTALLTFSTLIEYPSTSTSVDSLRALAFHLSGLINYKLTEYDQAILDYEEAIALRDQLYPTGHNDAAKSRYNLGNTYLVRDDLVAAERAFQASNMIYEQLADPDTMRWLRTLRQLSDCYGRLRDQQMARGVVERAMPLFKTYYRHDTLELGYWYYNLGANLSNIGQAEIMARMMDSAALYFQLAEAEYEMIEAIHARATAKMEMEDYAGARQSLLSIFGQLQELDFDSPLRNAAYFNSAITSMELGQYKKAHEEGRAAFSGYKSATDSVSMSQVAHLLARNSSKSGNTNRANFYFTQAIALLTNEADGTFNIDQVPASYLYLVANILIDRADEFSRLEDYQVALDDFDAAFALLDRIRRELSSEASQNWISANAKPFFQKAIDLQFLLYQKSGDSQHAWAALELSERSKAFSLLVATRQLAFERPRRQRELGRQIAILERSANKNDQVELGKLRIELERLQKIETAELPEIPQFQAETMKAFLATNNQTLLEYALGKTNSYLFVLPPSGDLVMEQLPDESDLTAAVRGFRSAIQASAYKRKSLNKAQADLDLDFKVAGLQLSKAVFGSASNVIFASNNLLIVPDGVLGFLPFSALLTADPGAPPLQYADLPYLQRGRQLTYGYSATYLLEVVKRPLSKAGDNLLAFAPVFRGDVSAAQSSQVRAARPASGQRSLPALLPLRYNEEEVNTVASLIPRSETYVGDYASREAFEQEAANYRMLLISSHAFVDASDPNLSFIAFTQQGDSLETDEMLYLNDLGALRLPVDLAVLSACETSMGKVVPGEGVLSLARAFAAAGATSTLTTLWKVDDEATKQFSVDFFKALSQGNGRSQSVALAQERALASPDFAHPYYWSAMTLYGSNGPVEIRPGFALNDGSIYTLLFIAIVMISMWYLKRQKRGLLPTKEDEEINLGAGQ